MARCQVWNLYSLGSMFCDEPFNFHSRCTVFPRLLFLVLAVQMNSRMHTLNGMLYTCFCYVITHYYINHFLLFCYLHTYEGIGMDYQTQVLQHTNSTLKLTEKIFIIKISLLSSLLKCLTLMLGQIYSNKLVCDAINSNLPLQELAI